MKRITLDTNAVNNIAEAPGFAERIRAAVEQGSFTIIGNPMVGRELENTDDTTR